MTVTAERVLWRDCKYCGIPFVQGRARGRPRVTCSDGCREARGVHGDVRLTRGASRGTGVRFTVTSERHSSGDSNAAILADLFGGDYEDDEPGSWVVESVIRDELKRSLAWERRTAGDNDCVTDVYGLEPARDEGRTCPEIKRVIGLSLAWDWQDKLSA